MNKIILILIFILTPFYCFSDEMHIPFKWFGMLDKNADKIWELVSRCDIEIVYEGNGKVDIGVGKRDKSNVRSPVNFDLDELDHFFDSQKHKELIVVFFSKIASMKTENIKETVSNLNEYFFKRGYKRVVLLQSLAFGVGLYSDQSNTMKNS